MVFASYVEKNIVNLMELNNELDLYDDGTVMEGCSVRIQKLINFGKEYALGGFEYLYSLPASVGGFVYIIAGRGRMHLQQISDQVQVEKPSMLSKMLEIAQRLSEDFDLVRIDLYQVDNKIYFGEITLSPAGGSFPSWTREALFALSSYYFSSPEIVRENQ